MGYTPDPKTLYNYSAGTMIKEVIIQNTSKTQYFGKVNDDQTRTYIKQVWTWGNVATKGVSYNWIFERWDYLDNATVSSLGLANTLQTTLNNKIMEQITGTGANYESIQYAPSNLSYKEQCQWYETKIFGGIKQVTDLAIQLGEDPEKVGKALVSASQQLTIAATAINPLAGAIAGAVSAVVQILDAFDVFTSSAKEQYANAKTQFGINNLVLTRWMEEYNRTIQKWHAVDDVEFTTYINKLKASSGVIASTGGPSTTGGTGNGNTGLFASFGTYLSDNKNTVIIVALIAMVLYFLYKKSR